MVMSRRELILLAVFVNFAASANSKIPWWNIKMAQEQGPNVCVVEEVPGTKHKLYTECKYWRDRDICGQKAIIRYECCEGYQQVNGQLGCTGVKPLKNVLETAKDLGAGKFVQYLQDSGIANQLRTGGVYTLFAPLDSAFENLPREQKVRLDDFRYSAQNPVLLYHILQKKLTSQQFKADLLTDTRYNHHKLRINKYSNGMETVNCIKILRKDQEANNGVVHIIDDVLDPLFTMNRNLVDVVMQDGRFTQLSRAMENSEFINKLRTSQQPCTFLAPSDEAFQKISKPRLDRIMADQTAKEALLENHILQHPICLPAVVEEHKVRTMNQHKVSFDCDKKGVTVEKKRLRSEFTMGENGVLYMVDDVILPDRAKSIIQILEEEKLFAFLQLIRFSGLTDSLENFGEYTIFAPTEDAMFGMPGDTLSQLKTDKSKARQFVLYHATQSRIRTDEMSDNQALMSLDEINKLRLQVYRKSVGVEDAIIVKPDIDGMNGCVHIINKALTPSNVSAGDILRQDGNFSIFLTAMEKAMQKNPEILELQNPKTTYTFFVPTDQAFNKLGSAKLHRIMDNDVYLTKTIKNHVVEDMLTSEGFRSDLYYDIQTRQNMVDIVKKNGKLKVNDATMTTCDLLNTNGVIHVINKVLLPDEKVREG